MQVFARCRNSTVLVLILVPGICDCDCEVGLARVNRTVLVQSRTVFPEVSVPSVWSGCIRQSGLGDNLFIRSQAYSHSYSYTPQIAIAVSRSRRATSPTLRWGLCRRVPGQVQDASKQASH